MVLKPLSGARSLSDTGLSPSPAGLSSALFLETRFLTPRGRCGNLRQRLQPPLRNAHTLTRTGFRLLPFRSPLLRESFLFLRVLRCFSSPRAPRMPILFSMRSPGIPLGGFPHSDISGSTPVDSSPKLFAACHVLLRPLTPRHPPCALTNLINSAFAGLILFSF